MLRRLVVHILFIPVTGERASGSEQRLERARCSLATTVEQCLNVGRFAVGPAFPLPAESGIGVARALGGLPSRLEEAARAVGRYSQLMWSGDAPDSEELRMAREHGLQSLMRLVAWVAITVGLPVDRPTLTAAAADYLKEVEAEDDGVAHAADAIAGLIEMTVGARSQHPWGVDREPERHAVEILAPLIAQIACLNESVHGG